MRTTGRSKAAEALLCEPFQGFSVPQAPHEASGANHATFATLLQLFSARELLNGAAPGNLVALSRLTGCICTHTQGASTVRSKQWALKIIAEVYDARFQALKDPHW